MSNRIAVIRKGYVKKWFMTPELVKCGLCGKGFDVPTDITVDHIQPKSRGGSNRITNLQPAHLQCNQDKGNRVLIAEPFMPDPMHYAWQWLCFLLLCFMSLSKERINKMTNKKITEAKPRDFSKLMGVLQLFVLVSICYTVFVVYTGTTGLAPKLMLIPQALFAAVLAVRKFTTK